MCMCLGVPLSIGVSECVSMRVYALSLCMLEHACIVLCVTDTYMCVCVSLYVNVTASVCVLSCLTASVCLWVTGSLSIRRCVCLWCHRVCVSLCVSLGRCAHYRIRVSPVALGVIVWCHCVCVCVCCCVYVIMSVCLLCVSVSRLPS